jgi:hypothetical protein
MLSVAVKSARLVVVVLNVVAPNSDAQMTKINDIFFLFLSSRSEPHVQPG